MFVFGVHTPNFKFSTCCKLRYTAEPAIGRHGLDSRWGAQIFSEYKAISIKVVFQKRKIAYSPLHTELFLSNSIDGT